MALDKAAVAEIKRLYHGSELTLDEIGEQYGLAATSVSRLARTQGWLMRSVMRGNAPRRHLPTTEKARELLAHQLCDAITSKLKQMETDMTSGRLTSQDYERDTNSVSAMIGGLEKVTATATHADKERKPKCAEPAPPADAAERLHREIVERFERLQRRRNSQAGSG